MSKVKVIPYKDKRFAVVDSNTGKIVDDARGYGFTSQRAAWACWAWKNRPPEVVKREKELKKWLKKNPNLLEKLEDRFTTEYFYAIKYEEEKFTFTKKRQILAQALKDLNLTTEYSPYEIIKVFEHGVK